VHSIGNAALPAATAANANTIESLGFIQCLLQPLPCFWSRRLSITARHTCKILMCDAVRQTQSRAHDILLIRIGFGAAVHLA